MSLLEYSLSPAIVNRRRLRFFTCSWFGRVGLHLLAVGFLFSSLLRRRQGYADLGDVVAVAPDGSHCTVVECFQRFALPPEKLYHPTSKVRCGTSH